MDDVVASKRKSKSEYTCVVSVEKSQTFDGKDKAGMYTCEGNDPTRSDKVCMYTCEGNDPTGQIRLVCTFAKVMTLPGQSRLEVKPVFDCKGPKHSTTLSESIRVPTYLNTFFFTHPHQNYLRC